MEMNNVSKGIKVELLSHTMNPEDIISSAAKLCYSGANIEDLINKVSSADNSKFIKMLSDIGHESVFEHSSFTFGVEGVSRITEIQLVRHRIGCSYSIQSGRYVNRSNAEFVVPNDIKESGVASRAYQKAVDASMRAYDEIFMALMLRKMGLQEDMLEVINEESKMKMIDTLFQTDKETYKKLEKESIESARYAHLQSISTKIILTMNARSLFNFLSARTCSRAQEEIRTMAREIMRICKSNSPNIFSNCGPKCIVEGKCSEGHLKCSTGPQL